MWCGEHPKIERVLNEGMVGKKHPMCDWCGACFGPEDPIFVIPGKRGLLCLDCMAAFFDEKTVYEKAELAGVQCHTLEEWMDKI